MTIWSLIHSLNGVLGYSIYNNCIPFNCYLKGLCTIYTSLWVWGRALAPWVSSITNTELQRDAEPHPVIPPNAKKNHRIFPKQLRPEISTSLSTTRLCLPSTVMQLRVICYYIICQRGPRNRSVYSFLCICVSLAVWLCIKMSSGSMVLMSLLQIEANDLTRPYLCHGIYYYIVCMTCSLHIVWSEKLAYKVYVFHDHLHHLFYVTTNRCYTFCTYNYWHIIPTIRKYFVMNIIYYLLMV